MIAWSEIGGAGSNIPRAVFTAKRVIRNGQARYQPVATPDEGLQRVYVLHEFNTRADAIAAAERLYLSRL